MPSQAFLRRRPCCVWQRRAIRLRALVSAHSLHRGESRTRTEGSRDRSRGEKHAYSSSEFVAFVPAIPRYELMGASDTGSVLTKTCRIQCRDTDPLLRVPGESGGLGDNAVRCYSIRPCRGEHTKQAGIVGDHTMKGLTKESSEEQRQNTTCSVHHSYSPHEHD